MMKYCIQFVSYTPPKPLTLKAIEENGKQLTPKVILHICNYTDVCLPLLLQPLAIHAVSQL